MPSYEIASQELGPKSVLQLERASEIAGEAFRQALTESRTVSIPHAPLKETLSHLGDKINARYAGMRRGMDTPDETARIARKWLWFAARQSQLTWHNWIAEGFVQDTEQTRRYAESLEAGYQDLGEAFNDHLANLDCIEAIKSDHPSLTPYDLLEAISLVWFCEADSHAGVGDTEGAMAKIADAYSAIESAHSLYMWEEGNKCAIEDAPSPASVLAKRRHAENYALKVDALKYWHEHIDPTISASKAANELVRVVPLSHKKLAELIAAEKKNQR